jgi:uncharacterized protein (TIGR02145 family)
VEKFVVISCITVDNENSNVIEKKYPYKYMDMPIRDIMHCVLINGFQFKFLRNNVNKLNYRICEILTDIIETGDSVFVVLNYPNILHNELIEALTISFAEIKSRLQCEEFSIIDYTYLSETACSSIKDFYENIIVDRSPWGDYDDYRDQWIYYLKNCVESTSYPSQDLKQILEDINYSNQPPKRINWNYNEEQEGILDWDDVINSGKFENHESLREDLISTITKVEEKLDLEYYQFQIESNVWFMANVAKLVIGEYLKSKRPQEELYALRLRANYNDNAYLLQAFEAIDAQLQEVLNEQTPLHIVREFVEKIEVALPILIKLHAKIRYYRPHSHDNGHNAIDGLRIYIQKNMKLDVNNIKFMASRFLKLYKDEYEIKQITKEEVEKKQLQAKADRLGGVVINGVIWATRNINTPGEFTAKAEDPGMFYQWNRNVGWSVTDPMVNTNGETTWDDSNPTGDIWEVKNNICPKGWRLPTVHELNSLARSDSKWTTINGIGRKFGSEGHSIFLPSTKCYREYRNGKKDTLLSHYWSSTACNSDEAYSISVSHVLLGRPSRHRGCGLLVRCVAE